MAKRKKRTAVIGLDVGSTAVKAVALRRHGDVLTITGCARIGIAEVDEPVQAVRRVLRQGGFKANRIVAGIAGRGVMLQTVNIALDENRDLDDAILDEAEKLLPYDPDEAELDYQILPESAGGRISALLAAVRKRDAEKRLEILQSAGVRPERLD
ncbi:MAG: pilus assembly protein PilM, partial [Planctomycetes bacterium]|nr:pilus assembly protein PilM [Planctomycetota bacterium]